MSSNNTVPVQSLHGDEKSDLLNIYSKFQTFIGRLGVREYSSAKIENIDPSTRSNMAAFDDSSLTPNSSKGDLIDLSPKKLNLTEQPSVSDDLLTDANFDSICDVTMQEIPSNYDLFRDENSINYLVKCAESNSNQNVVDRGKESLFVKFDPLYAKKFKDSMNSIHTSSEMYSAESDIGYETGSIVSSITDYHPSSPKLSVSTGCLQTSSARDKPMQVVPPVVSNSQPKVATSQCKPSPGLIRSVSAILIPQRVATDRLINISGSTPPTADPCNSRFIKYKSQETEHLSTIRNMLYKQDEKMFNQERENRELRSALQDSQHKLSHTVEEYETKLKKLNEEKLSLIEQMAEKDIRNKQMSIVMEEYEKTISSLIQEQQQDKLQFEETQTRLTQERDQAVAHLENMESSFNDLLSKYEKCKAVVVAAKKSEAVFKQNIQEYEEGMSKYDSLYNTLKQVTSESLDKANETLESMKKNHNVEIMKLNAAIKKQDITIASLQETLAQKVRDNEELTRICDQLINEVR